MAAKILAILGLCFSLVAVAGAPYTEREMRAAEVGDESKIRQIREEEITQIRIALGRRAAANRRADLYFRLAEIYIEAYRSEYILEGRVHDRRLERGEEDKFIDHSHSQPFLNAGVKACNEIISYKIPFAKLDQVYYFLGFNHSELGDRSRGTKYFEYLTQHFPSSPFVVEAYKELGNAAYDQANYRKAQGYYEQALRAASGKSAHADSLPHIHHRLAWCYYRTKQFDRAVETMKQAVTSAQGSGEKYLSLHEEALRDMAMFMTETGQVEQAIRYFSQVVNDKQYYPKLLEKLGKQYERNVEPAKATQVYESLLKTNPESESAFRVLVKLVDLDLRRGRFTEALTRIAQVKVPTGGEHETQVASQNLRAMIRRTATEHHEKFRRTGNRPSLGVAESYYTTYLDTFLSLDDSRRETPEIQMYLAEVKRELGKDREASQLYRKVLESKDKRYAKEAGALWTSSLSESIRKTAQSTKTPAGAKAAEPSALEVEFIEAADRLQEALGETNEGREAALRAAQVQAGYKDTKKTAIKRIKKIIDKWPRTAQALTAAQLWLQLEAEGDPDDLKSVIKELRKNDTLLAFDQESGGKLKAQLADQDTRLKISVIDREEKNHDFDDAGKNYESFANDSQGKDLAEKAYANAVTSYLKAGGSDAAEGIERVAGSWLKRYPKSARVSEALRGAATQFLVTGQFEPAARIFDKLGREASDADSLETAAKIFDGIGETGKAQQARSAHLQAFPSSPRRSGVALDLARSLDSSRQDAPAVTAYRTCMSAGDGQAAAECGARLGDLYMRNQEVPQAKAAYREVSANRGTASRPEKRKAKRKKGKAKQVEPPAVASSAGAVKGVSSPFVGYARFKLAELLEQEAKFERMELPEERLKKGLNQRMEFLEPLSRAYLSAVDAGGPWAVAALDRLAGWAMGFADEVDNISPPHAAEGEAINRFHKSLQQVSSPLRKRAITTWAEAYAKALSAESLSPVLPAMSDRLADALGIDAKGSNVPARAQGFRGRLRLAGVPADGGQDGRSTSFKKTRDRLSKSVQDTQAWVDYGNLLWGDGRPGLARIAYERALSLNARSPAALNNHAVVVLSTEGEEAWLAAAEANQFFLDALKIEEFFLAAKMNRAALLSYYRLFSKARPIWDQILIKVVGTDAAQDAHDGLGIVLQGMGQQRLAETEFMKATEAGARKSRFALLYHEAARIATQTGLTGAEQCLSKLSDIDSTAIAGFEKSSVEHLKNLCSRSKGEASGK